MSEFKFGKRSAPMENGPSFFLVFINAEGRLAKLFSNGESIPRVGTQSGRYLNLHDN